MPSKWSGDKSFAKPLVVLPNDHAGFGLCWRRISSTCQLTSAGAVERHPAWMESFANEQLEDGIPRFTSFRQIRPRYRDTQVT